MGIATTIVVVALVLAWRLPPMLKAIRRHSRALRG